MSSMMTLRELLQKLIHDYDLDTEVAVSVHNSDPIPVVEVISDESDPDKVTIVGGFPGEDSEEVTG